MHRVDSRNLVGNVICVGNERLPDFWLCGFFVISVGHRIVYCYYFIFYFLDLYVCVYIVIVSSNFLTVGRALVVNGVRL